MKFSRDGIKKVSDADLPAALAAAQFNLERLKADKNGSTEFWQAAEQCVQIRQEFTLRKIATQKTKAAGDELSEE